MRNNERKSTNDTDTDKQNDIASKKSDTSGSDNDVKIEQPPRRVSKANTRSSTKTTPKVTGYRTITLRVPLVERQYKLKKAPVRRRTTRTVVPPAKKKLPVNEIMSLINSLIMNLLRILAISAICYYIYSSVYSPNSDTCDLNKIKSPDFNDFYGIVELKNHFSPSPDNQCDSDIIFKPVLPQAVLKSDNSASSFMILAKYGTGKSLLRCKYYNSLKSDDYFKILILNKQINEHLERYISETSINGKDCRNEYCLMGWSKNEFAQLILSLLVTQFIDTYQKEQFHLPDISLDEKIELIIIICYYYNDHGVYKLENFINSFLKKSDNSYSARKANGQILERNNFQDKPLLTHFKKDLNKLHVIRKDDKKLELLLSIVEGEGYQHTTIEKTMSNNVFNSLTDFTLFMKNHMNKPVVFIIDDIQYISHQKNDYKTSIELFIRSSISSEILSGVMAENFYLSLFYPDIDGINIQDAIIRSDKFPIYSINWDSRSVINYADHLLQKLKKTASRNRCKSLPDFKTLVNYSNEATADIIDRIPTPRALHYFMEKLITEMNKCTNDVENPFIATHDNVNNAFKKSIQFL